MKLLFMQLEKVTNPSILPTSSMLWKESLQVSNPAIFVVVLLVCTMLLERRLKGSGLPLRKTDGS